MSSITALEESSFRKSRACPLITTARECQRTTKEKTRRSASRNFGKAHRTHLRSHDRTRGSFRCTDRDIDRSRADQKHASRTNGAPLFRTTRSVVRSPPRSAPKRVTPRVYVCICVRVCVSVCVCVCVGWLGVSRVRRAHGTTRTPAGTKRDWLLAYRLT